MTAPSSYDEVLADHAGRYLSLANALEDAGQIERACAFRSLAAAYQVLPKWRKYDTQRGSHFEPLSTGVFGNVPDMEFLRKPETIAVIRSRLQRTRSPYRRARLADVVWEYSGDPAAARQAIDAHLVIGELGLASDAEHAAMFGAGSLARALVLARNLGDADRLSRLQLVVTNAMTTLRERDEHVALFVLAEALLAIGAAEQDLAAADAALECHYERLIAIDADNFQFQRAIVSLRRRIAVKRGAAQAALTAMSRTWAEVIVREATWKGKHYENGAQVEMHFLEEAALQSEQLGDAARAIELRGRQRATFPRATFQRVEGKVQLDAGAIREWLNGGLGAPERRADLWRAIWEALPVPTGEAIDAAQAAERANAPFLALANVITMNADGVTEVVSAEEGARRRARHFACEQHGLIVALLLKLAGEDHGVRANEALSVLVASGRFDKTSQELLQRILAAYDGRDWLTVGYLAGSLIERLTRALAKSVGLETMRSSREAGQVRRIQVSIEDLLRRLPLGRAALEYLKWVTGHPGLNLRNDAGHGLLEWKSCHEVLGAHVIYVLLILTFVDLTGSDQDAEKG